MEGFLRELQDLTENKVGQLADIGCLWTCSLCWYCFAHSSLAQRGRNHIVNIGNSSLLEENSLEVFIWSSECFLSITLWSKMVIKTMCWICDGVVCDCVWVWACFVAPNLMPCYAGNAYDFHLILVQYTISSTLSEVIDVITPEHQFSGYLCPRGCCLFSMQILFSSVLGQDINTVLGWRSWNLSSWSSPRPHLLNVEKFKRRVKRPMILQQNVSCCNCQREESRNGLVLRRERLTANANDRKSSLLLRLLFTDLLSRILENNPPNLSFIVDRMLWVTVN